MSTENLLVELFTEELPPKVLKKLGDAFAAGIFNGLKKRGLLGADSIATMFATPRRLAVHVTGVNAVAPDEVVVRKLMPVSVGIDAAGDATQALIKKLTALGRANFDVADLEHEGEGKAAQLLLRDLAKGQSLQVALQSAIEESVDALPVPKVMSYQLVDGVTTVKFVRPVHGLVALHGRAVVPIFALGHDAAATTHGHRFQGSANIELKHADEYESRLEMEGGVMASFDKRRDEVKRLLFVHAEQAGDTLGDPADYEALLDEVTALVEMPTVYTGQFEAEFLQVPTECLVLTMKLNQKYFPLFHSEGGLSSRFLIVSNMRLDDPRNVIEGNQRVVRPRLADARFFFETDKKTKLVDRVPKLASVVYHNKLGSQGERIERVRKLASHIAGLIGADASLADRAALLAKADLVTDMVGEFPELQGTMGRYYARHDGEQPAVADAIAEHYLPRIARDKLPDSLVGQVVALADKLETLAGLFGVGQQPSGDKDPFALRRHALGVLRILIEKRIVLPLGKLVDSAFAVFNPGLLNLEARADLEKFLFDRLRGLLRELEYSANEVESVIGDLNEGIHVAPKKLSAVRALMKLPEGASLASANKRISNILSKNTNYVPSQIDDATLIEPAEKELFGALRAAQAVVRIQLGSGDYEQALISLAPLKIPVDAFFDSVLVNVEDATIRGNRLALLRDLRALMNKIADLSKLAT